ncbi:APC family permease [Actinoplanes sp. NPDC051513]|uniref:APC family permease n=1 Tax=Actinoplanes sp. NPDC051513 TaxID=3363908 RepID=UPI0037884252
MSAPATGHTASLSVSSALAADRLGAFTVGTTIASSVAPLTVVALVVSTALAATGLVGVPIAIIAVALLLMLFVVGYLAMARHIPNTGAFGAYVAQGIGRPFGVGTSWVALATYLSFELCCFGGFAAAIAVPLLQKWFDVSTPWFIPAFIMLILVAVLGANEVKVSGKVLIVLVVGETILVVVYSIAIISTPGFHFTFAALAPANLWGPGAGTLFVIGMTAFAGIEQSAVYIEESKNPLRTIPIATYATIATICAVYVFASLVVISAGGPQIIARATTEGPDLFFNEATVLLGTAALTVGAILLGTSLIAAKLAFHNAVSRYAYALGREGVLLRVLGRTTRKGAPRTASVIQSVLVFTVLALYAAAGWDPLVQLFYWGSTTGGFGVLLLITLTSIAVIAYFARDPHGEKLWHRLLAPTLASGILLFVAYLATDNLPLLFAVDPGTGPARIVPLAFLIIFAAGICWGLILRRTRPTVYEGIGRGTRATVSASTSALSAVFQGTTR